ncbi:MAG: hypothetical protein ACK41U_11500 [Paracoccus sp. (in: a-proteobacteria)]|uniref:hypothetical protein n=1 Tax=Paracoccus sp. TaxID=267 RepID=UPI00391BE3B0
MTRDRPLPALLALVLLAACAPDAAEYPALRPTAEVLAEPVLPAHATAARTPADAARTEAATSARAEALRRRAGGLRAPVIEPATRARLDRAAS